MKNKKCYRFFGGLLLSQERWLNKMARQGWRLVNTGRLLYEFAPCQPEQYQYCVEFVGHKSHTGAVDYAAFLESCGYRVFFKNINLNWSTGKVTVRPWAEKGGRLATSSTTINRELLLVEKENDGKPFSLHTTIGDKQTYLKALRQPWLFLCALSLVMAFVQRQPVWGIFAAVTGVGLIAFQIELMKLARKEKTEE